VLAYTRGTSGKKSRTEGKGKLHPPSVRSLLCHVYLCKAAVKAEEAVTAASSKKQGREEHTPSQW